MNDNNETNTVIEKVFRAFNEHDLDKFQELLLEDSVLIPGGKNIEIKGPAAMAAAVQPTLDAIPDLTVNIKNCVTERNKGVVELVRCGTHTGEAKAPDGRVIAPTGKRVELPECIVFEIKDGKVKKMIVYVDLLDTFQQLGVFPIEKS